jgi:hypothetical protein
MEGGSGGRNRRALRVGEAGGGARPGRHLGPKRGGELGRGEAGPRRGGGLRAWLGRASWAAQVGRAERGGGGRETEGKAFLFPFSIFYIPYFLYA